MAQISVGESIRAIFEPHDQGVHLTYGADQGMVDEIIDRVRRYKEAEAGVEEVGKCNGSPSILLVDLFW